MRKFADLEKEGYKGVDASLETSLYEYGLIWKESDKDTTFIYGVAAKPNDCKEMEFYKFDWSTIEKGVDPKKEWDFIDDEDWNDIRGDVTEEEFFAKPLTWIVSDIINYWGYENTFGTAYHPFMIEKED